MASVHIRRPLLVTNNPACQAAYKSLCTCLCDEAWTYGQVLQQAKQMVRQGYRLLSHPLAGSMKPNQTPFRTVLLAQHAADGADTEQSLAMLDAALRAYQKFQAQRATPSWSHAVRKDFGVIDLSMMQGVMERAGLWTARQAE